MSESSVRGIFLSYRREDAAPYARLLQQALRNRIPDAPVFMDVDSVEAGLDFVDAIREAIASCAVLVALIGRQWATLADEEGRRRLDDPGDWVRFEIKSALELGVRVIPVLVDGAKPLKEHQLPSELQKFALLNAFELSHGRYESDADRLLDLIQQVIVAESGSGTAHKSLHTARQDGRLSDLLDPHQEVVPFTGRRNELARLVAWCDDDEAGQLRIVTGSGGAGKTRLALRLVEEMTARGWHCEWIRAGQEASAVASIRRMTQRRALLIIDYAETRVGLEDMLRAAAADKGPALRILLLARQTGDWWRRLESAE